MRQSVSSLVVLAGMMSPAVFAAPPENHEQELIQLILESDDATTLRVRVAQLVDEASPAQLQDYKTHPHHTIALSAAWEEVRRSVCNCHRNRKGEEGFAIVPYDRRVLQRFLGFADGRLGVTPPEWWLSVMARLKTTQDRHDSVQYPSSVITREMPYRGPEGSFQTVSPIDVTRREDGTLKLESESYSCVLPECWSGRWTVHQGQSNRLRKFALHWRAGVSDIV